MTVYKESTEYAQQHYDSYDNFAWAVNGLFSTAFWTAVATIAIACFTWTLKRSTDRLWEAGEKQRRLYEDTAERQLRAYVVVDASAIEGFGTDAVRVVITIKNAGQTPAHDLVTWMGVKVSQFPIVEKLEPPPADIRDSPGSLGPRGEQHMFHSIVPPLREEENTAIRVGRAAIYVFGELRYKDIFETERLTKFRYFYVGHICQAGMLACDVEGNEAT